jgi:hypothetical protein
MALNVNFLPNLNSTLISRWLFNVEAIKEWASLPEPTRSQTRIAWWQQGGDIPERFHIPAFIGQGRLPGYCGLPYAVLSSIENFARTQTKTPIAILRAPARPNSTEPPITTTVTHSVCKTLDDGRPWPWVIVAFTSQFLVWVAILSAFVVSYTAPTRGLGCRTLTYLVFGFFSSVPWILQFLRGPISKSAVVVWTSRLCSAFAVITLLVAVIFQVRSSRLK